MQHLLCDVKRFPLKVIRPSQPTAGVYTPGLPNNLDFVAMQWSGSGAHLISDFQSSVPPVTALLAFNEPNNPIQVRTAPPRLPP